jgi:hypothetical protein
LIRIPDSPGGFSPERHFGKLFNPSAVVLWFSCGVEAAGVEPASGRIILEYWGCSCHFSLPNIHDSSRAGDRKMPPILALPSDRPEAVDFVSGQGRSNLATAG